MKSEIDTPILSFIVPTKNRYYYLDFLVKYFHELTDPSIELIIEDNSDSSNEQIVFEEKTARLKDSRIIYNYSDEDLSIIENSDRALSRAQGKYVTFIGDDDIFSRHIIEFTRNAAENDIDVFLPIKPSYSWPDVHSRTYGDKFSGKFTQTKFTGKSFPQDVDKIINKVLSTGGTEILNLPRLYHGVVKMSLLEKIHQDSGSYFPGPSPDMANAVALCKYVRNFKIVDLPLIVSGHSKTSGGGLGAGGNHFGEISKLKHLPKNTADEWSSFIPFYWSGNTIYAESVVKALKRMQMENLMTRFDYNYLYASCLVFDNKYIERIKKAIKKAKQKNKPIKNFKILGYYCWIWIKRIWFHLTKNLLYLLPNISNKNIHALENIREVADLNDHMIGNHLTSKGFL